MDYRSPHSASGRVAVGKDDLVDEYLGGEGL